MPINEVELTELLLKAKLKLNDLNNETESVRVLISNLREVEGEEDPQDKTKRLDPVDLTLGIKMSVNRRQEIYDKAKSDSVTLGI